MKIVDGILYSVDEGDLVNGELRIPKEVKEIDHSFENNLRWCIDFNTLTFEKGSEIERITERAFIGSLYLKKVDLSNCKKLLEIGSEAFTCSGDLEEINVSGCENLSHIAPDTFKNCKHLKGVDFTGCPKLEWIDARAFYGCEGLGFVDFAGLENLELVSVSAFEGCTSLESANFAGCKSLCGFFDRVFRGCDKLKSVAFDDCVSLINFGRECFCNCTNLKYVSGFDKLESLDYIGASCFENSGLEEITFPKSDDESREITVEIGAFTACRNLRRVNGEGCRFHRIGDVAFAGCASLKEVLFNGAVITKILNPFFECENMETIDFRNVTGVKDFDLNTVSADKVLFSDGARWDAFKRYYQAFTRGTKILLYNKKGEVSKQFVRGDGNPYEGVRIGANYLVKLLEAKGTKIDFCLLNNLYSKEEADTFLNKKNVKQYEDMMNACFGEVRQGRENFVEFLRKLGYFGFEDCSTGKLNSEDEKYGEYEKYKRLLAKKYVYSKIKNDIKAGNNKDYINKIVNRKVMEVARTHSLNDLVRSFVMNNIASSKYKDELFDALKCVEWTEEKDVRFAQFMVLNFDEIMKRGVIGRDWEKCRANKDYEDDEYEVFYSDDDLRFDVLFEKFPKVLASLNKEVITRSDRNRLVLDDFKAGALYDDVVEGNKELAVYCSKMHVDQYGFRFLSNLLEEGMAVRDKQVLKVREDEVASGKDLSDERNADLITYKVLEKGDPLGLVLGNITNCCQIYGGAGQDCMTVGATDVNSSFMTISKGNKILAQGWIWYDSKTKTVAIDNIEVPIVMKNIVNNEKKDEVIECIQRFCDNAFKTMNENGYEVKNVVIGASNTDVIKSLNHHYRKETREDKLIDCPFYITRMDGREEKVYSDVAKGGQFVVYRDGERMYNNSNVINNMISETIERGQ